ncbi:DUF3883 domain-containing protein [Actinomadura rubrisoli]|uniref:DUF3883 domain-containing protein n=1 Tax=Actinomadura rubrisoli TaxID=2530368 RepID=A0A4R5AHI7_9ACTN|nr:DUF3883 domain-containing protein [Actinomadura rubrisoli]TDD70876.1 DUF3883 domain-containing protein [Actinomadura rubrisoli]
MQATADDGRVLDADFAVEAEQGTGSLSLVLESQSGANHSRGRPARNTDYLRTLDLLLVRLKRLNAVLVDGIVDSRATNSLPEDERRLFPSAIRLADEHDLKDLRVLLCRAQREVGRESSAPRGRNNTKRIRLRLQVPGYTLADAAKLATGLSSPPISHGEGVLQEVTRLANEPTALATAPSTAPFEKAKNHAAGETAVMMVHVPQAPYALLNLSVGLETNTWGFPGVLTYPSYEYVIFGIGASPRVQLDDWLGKSATLYVCQAGARPYMATAPHMPDEIAEGRVKWLTRIGFEPLGRLDDVPLGDDGPLSRSASDALRRSGTHRGFGRMGRTNMNLIFQRLGLTADTLERGVPQVPFSQTAPVTVESLPRRRNAGRPFGVGRQMDPAKRRAVEQRAVKMAKEHYEAEGWEVEELGKPYDLRLTKPCAERHVEVKGTTGALGSVELTINEVLHAREFPDVDLCVVTDITITTVGPEVDHETQPGGKAPIVPSYVASGGTFHLRANWTPADEDLRATRFEYRVPSEPDDVLPR